MTPIQSVKRLLAKVGMLLVLLSLLAACGGEAATSVPAATATSGASTSNSGPTNTPAAAAAAATPTLGEVTLGSGSVKIEWWHISTAADQRANWQTLAQEFVKTHPNVSIKITVLENEAFKSKLATAM